MSIDEHNKSKRGRPPVDSEMVRARLDRTLLNALDTWIAAQPEPRPTRPEAVRLALKDWLTHQGLLPFMEDPE